ncbi:MAG: hypothetical protein QOG26_752, partial [Solirubrobacterales bacterium]|nr:hypothetical protein [Solirubrobacterales bacterium]
MLPRHPQRPGRHSERPPRHPERSEGSGWRRLTTLALTLALVPVIATIARADDPALPVDPGSDPTSQIPQDPGQACQDQVDKTAAGSTTQGAGCDNNYTPIAKDGTKLSWAQ